MHENYSLRREKILNAVKKSIDELNPEIIVRGRNRNIHSFSEGSTYSIISLGKAATHMARGIDRRIVEKANLRLCISNQKESEVYGFTCFPGDHPIPGINTFTSSEKILDLLKNDSAERLIVLLSGGTSSIFESHIDTITDEQYRDIMGNLINQDYPIEKLNMIRYHLSKIKFGKLLNLCKYRKILIFAISDVPGNEIFLIGSNPFYYAPDSYRKIPEEISEYVIQKEDSVKRKDLTIEYEIILDGSIYAKKLEVLLNSGISKIDLGRIIKGNVISLSTQIIKILRNHYSEINGPFWFVGHGESTAEVIGNGKGGRNSYLSSLIMLHMDDDDIFSFLSLATDGMDGNGNIAGFFVDEELKRTIPRTTLMKYIEESDTASLAIASGNSVITGQTGNNVSDVIIGYFGGKE